MRRVLAGARAQKLSKHKAMLGEHFACHDQDGLLRWALAQLAENKAAGAVGARGAAAQPPKAPQSAPTGKRCSTPGSCDAKCAPAGTDFNPREQVCSLSDRTAVVHRAVCGAFLSLLVCLQSQYLYRLHFHFCD